MQEMQKEHDALFNKIVTDLGEDTKDKRFHEVYQNNGQYYEELAALAGLEPPDLVGGCIFLMGDLKTYQKLRMVSTEHWTHYRVTSLRRQPQNRKLRTWLYCHA